MQLIKCCQTPRVKSVTGTVNGLVNLTYAYDSVGNLTEEKTGTTIQREITWSSLTRRGFTEHEMLPEVNMVHMNGRVYEPTLGRFMSADPTLQFAGFSQSYNRYSYGLWREKECGGADC